MANPHRVLALCNLVRRLGPKIVFLMEVKVGREKVERVRRRLQFEALFFMEGVNHGGGLALL